MPRKRKSVMASIQNGKRSGEDREVKRKRTEDSRMTADKENGVSPHHNLQHYLQCFSDRPPKPSKEHSQCHAQSTASSRGSYKQVPMPNSSPGHCPAFCQCGTPVHGILYQY